MKLKLSPAKISILIILTVLIIDQIIKIWIKTHMTFSDSHPIIGQWFQIRFIENEGMAFGIPIPGRFGKLTLSIFRIIAACAIGWYMNSLNKKKAHPGLIICFAFIMAGAVGNIIDSAFYGLIFSESNYFLLAQIFPEGGGYASFLHGKVVDMLHFPILSGTYPNWFPFIGGNDFTFFSPIFNIADSSISTGVIAIFIFQKRFFKNQVQENQSSPDKISETETVKK